MIQALIESLFISLICIGFKICYAEGKIFDFVGAKLQKMYDRGGFIGYLSMPLGACHYCMASVYGITFHLCMLSLGLAAQSALLPAILLVSIFLNGVFYAWYQKLDPHLFPKDSTQFFFRSRIINCVYWDLKEYFFLGFCIYAKRINIQQGHE